MGVGVGSLQIFARPPPLFFFLCVSSGLRGITCRNPGWSFSQAPSSDAFVAARSPWDRRRGSRGNGGSPVGGRVTWRAPDAGDRALGLETILGDCVDLRHSLLVLGTGCCL